MLYSWIYVGSSSVDTNSNTNSLPGDLSGALTWIKPPLPRSKVYPGGFANQTTVTGSSYAPPSPSNPILSFSGNSILTLLSNCLTNINLSDMETCYKVFRREVIQSIPLEENRFGFEPEITVKVAKRRLRIYEVGISYWGRTYEEGKKIGWKDGVRALWCLLKYSMKEPVAPAVAPTEISATTPENVNR